MIKAGSRKLGKISSGHTSIGALVIPLAEKGEDFTLQATAFVPEASDKGILVLPSILGLQGCLDRLRITRRLIFVTTVV